MKAGLYQFPPIFGDIKANVARVSEAIAKNPSDLIVLPELFNTGYQFISKEEALKLSEGIPNGCTTEALSELSSKLSMYIVAGVAEREGDSLYNSAVLTGPGGFIGKYRKTHLFLEEKLWFTAGDTGFRVWDTPVGKIGMMICFDWFFPESARTLALRGAEIIAHPSNLVLPHCPDAMVTRCIENRVFALTANRTGREERGGKNPLLFIGTSEIVSPSGEIICRAGAGEEVMLTAEIDPSSARDKGLNVFNNLFEDRRKKFYTL